MIPTQNFAFDIARHDNLDKAKVEYTIENTCINQLLKKVTMDIVEVSKNSLPCSDLECVKVQVKVPMVGPLPIACNLKWMGNHAGQYA